MTLAHLIQATENFNNQVVEFNHGDRLAFLFQKRWYPIYAVVNHAKELAGEPTDLTTNEALLELAKLHHYIRVEIVYFDNNDLPTIGNNECMSELRLILPIANSLIN